MKHLLEECGAMQSDLVEESGVSKAAVSLAINKKQWPKRHPEIFKKCVRDFFIARGISPERVDEAMGTLKKVGPSHAFYRRTNPQLIIPSEKEAPMLLQNETLTPAARKHFGMFRNPFADDVNSADDFFMSPDIRYCREVMWDVAKNGGFCALVGESGSGKTTLYEEMTERIKREGHSVLVTAPYVLAMESNDMKGKTLKSAQIAEAIIRTLDPTTSPMRSADARFNQLHRLLRASHATGNSHVVVIEEAHSLPVATLKHLKRFRELKDGFARLVGVILIGQPELKQRLSAHNPEVREVVQRCEVVELMPLDRNIREYVTHKLDRVGVKTEAVFEEDTFDAIRTKLTRTPRGGKASDAISICYPLVVNNLLAKAMNTAVTIGQEKVSGELILDMPA
jgi:type II secretory pathway predicted ATPase ExeA